ncbi:TonB-dependent receptor [Seonamhaeicola algicola]|uniref:TonB-dependent receptor n=1 Tax=Seonamhaeicola algicola TaxID=1719036 RepID=A0A5C7ASI1_9FLAO|nr:outer membrane beta-barrel family protein [Seonamhaeicola algicola]TXE11706.1 TonB-dependent receptor [Seonamhaeicola algicola]
MYKIFTLFFLLTSVINTNAQPKPQENLVIKTSTIKDVTVTGKVLDKETNDPLEYATISFFSKKANKVVTGGITDINGSFSIPVPQGTYDITIEYISYKTQKLFNQNIFKSQNLGTIFLDIDIASLGEVEIIAEKTSVEIKLDKKIYNVGKDLTVSGGSVSDVLDNVPSVSVDAEGGIALRGNDNVRILINGKPSGLVGLNSSDALQQLPADAIEKVEVITSPSARYEAEGTAGILNIILRRSKLQGLNGSVTANAGHPKAAGISGNINYRTGDLNFFNTTSYRYNERPGRWYNDVEYFDINTPDLNERRDFTRINNGITTNVGLEWYVNETASITTSVVYRNNNNENNSVNRMIQFDKINNTTTTDIRLDPEDGDRKTIQYALNFTKDFEKTDHKLTLDFQYEDNDDNEFSLINFNGTDTDILENIEKESKILLRSDYVLPIGNMSQIEMGVRGDFNNTSTDYNVELLNTNTNEFEVNTDLSNVFNFKQYLMAAYAQYGSKINKVSYLLGVRLENTRTTLDQPTTGDFKRKNLTGLFPTVNINLELSDDESITLGYNRRLRRPGGFMLNPFPSRSSITNVFQGNPDLDPTYTSKYEIGYLNRFGNITLSSAVYYAHATDVMAFVSRETGETAMVGNEAFPVIQRSPVNVATDDSYGIELNLNYSPSRKWRINTDVNFFKFEREGSFEGIDLGADNFTWRGRISNKVTLPFDIDWQTMANYRGPSSDNQNDREGVFSVNQALSKDLFNDKASIAFNVRDVFNSGYSRNNITADTFRAYQEIQFRGGTIYNVSFTYRFNQQKKRERNGDYDGGGDGMEM